MSYYYGKTGSMKLSTNVVVQVRNWKLTADTKTQDLTALGDTYDKEIPVSNKWTAKAEALFDLTDTNGQLALMTAYQNSTKITDIRFYVDGSKYWSPDTGSDAAAGAYIKQAVITLPQGGVATIELDIIGYGPGKWT